MKAGLRNPYNLLIPPVPLSLFLTCFIPLMLTEHGYKSVTRPRKPLHINDRQGRGALSIPVRGVRTVPGRFDSHALPPIK